MTPELNDQRGLVALLVLVMGTLAATIVVVVRLWRGNRQVPPV